MELPDAVCDLAEQQLGVFARRQFPDALPRHLVDDLLRSGRVERVLRGVYRVRGGAEHRHSAAIAAVLAAGPNSVLSGPAAVELCGVPGIHLGRQFVVLRPAALRPRRRGPGHDIDRDPDRRVHRLGAARLAIGPDALLDALRFTDELHPRQLRLVHDQLRWAGVLAPGQLGERAAELGLPPSLRSHELLALDRQDAAGDGERELGAILGAFSPRPEPQVWVTPRRRVDWFFRGVRTAVEYQGGADHGTEIGRASDRRREDELAEAGITVVHVTAADLRQPRTVLATVAGALAARADELRVAAPQLRPGG